MQPLPSFAAAVPHASENVVNPENIRPARVKQPTNKHKKTKRIQQKQGVQFNFFAFLAVFLAISATAMLSTGLIFAIKPLWVGGIALLGVLMFFAILILVLLVLSVIAN